MIEDIEKYVVFRKEVYNFQYLDSYYLPSWRFFMVLPCLWWEASMAQLYMGISEHFTCIDSSELDFLHFNEYIFIVLHI